MRKFRKNESGNSDYPWDRTIPVYIMDKFLRGSNNSKENEAGKIVAKIF